MLRKGIQRNSEPTEELVDLESTNLVVIRRVCGQTWTRVRVKYYNY